MYFTHWRSFQAVALEGSFTGAAKRLDRSQPTITRQVIDLEQAFGVELFHRRGRQVELSAVGKALLPITERLFTTSDEAVELLQSASGLTTGHLRVSAVNPMDVVSLISAFSKAHPGITVSLTICNSDEALNALLDFRADVAMLASAVVDRRLSCIDFGSRPLVVYVNKDHAWADRRTMRFSELEGHKIIIRERGSWTRSLFDQACDEAGLSPVVSMEINNRDAFREAVAQGLGIGIVGEQGLAADDRLREIAIPDCGAMMYRQIAHLRERSDARLIRSFLDVSREIAEHM